MDVYRCAHCGAGPGHLMPRMQDWQCLACGNRTDMDGFMLPKEPVFEGSPTAWERRPR